MNVLSLAFVWAAVVVSLLVVREGRDRSILAATLLFAVSISSNLDGLYLVADRAVGSRNLLTLGGDLCLIFGTYYLARGIVRAVLPASARAERMGLAVVTLAAIVCVGLFLAIRMHGSTNNFMVSYGSQLPAAAYSLIQITYLGSSLLLAGQVVLRHFPDRTSPRGSRACASIVVAGCAMAAVLTLSVYTMDLSHLSGDKAIESMGQAVYAWANPLAITLVSGGLAGWRVCGWLPDALWNRQAAKMMRALRPIHQRVAQPRDLPPTHAQTAKLHRMIVEIRDAELTPGGTGSRLTQEESARISRATRMLGVPD